MYAEAAQINDIIASASRVLIIQADNPDGDSIGSALALEQIIGDMGKEPYLFCAVDMPGYLRYLPGWDRVNKELPDQFDASIIVDTSAASLLENLQRLDRHGSLGKKPCVVIDHHAVELTIPFATVVCNKEAVATGEVIYELGKQLDWPINLEAKSAIATAIMADSLGLVTEATSARSIHIIAELVEGGVNLSQLDYARRSMMRKSPALVHYKGELLQRVEYYADNRIALIGIPYRELDRYSAEYNPSILVLEDMRMTTGTQLVVALKFYKDGKVTGKIRANQDAPVAGELALHFGGGGHTYSSGFKVQDGRPFNEVKSECIKVATELLDKLEREKHHEAIQHTDA